MLGLLARREQSVRSNDEHLRRLNLDFFLFARGLAMKFNFFFKFFKNRAQTLPIAHAMQKISL